MVFAQENSQKPLFLPILATFSPLHCPYLHAKKPRKPNAGSCWKYVNFCFGEDGQTDRQTNGAGFIGPVGRAQKALSIAKIWCLKVGTYFTKNREIYGKTSRHGPPRFRVELVQVQVHFKFKVKKFSKVKEAVKDSVQRLTPEICKDISPIDVQGT